MADDWTHEQTDNPEFADQRNFYKVEKWTKDGSKVDRLLYAGNDLDMARELFREAVALHRATSSTLRYSKYNPHRARLGEGFPNFP